MSIFTTHPVYKSALEKARELLRLKRAAQKAKAVTFDLLMGDEENPANAQQAIWLGAWAAPGVGTLAALVLLDLTCD